MPQGQTVSMSRWMLVLRRFRARHYVVLAALVFFTVFATMQAARAFGHARGFRAPPDQPVSEWMTIGHVSRAYRVPPNVLERALGLPEGQPDRRPLGAIARDSGRSFAEVQSAVTAAIEAHRPPRTPSSTAAPTPPPDAPGPPP